MKSWGRFFAIGFSFAMFLLLGACRSNGVEIRAFESLQGQLAYANEQLLKNNKDLQGAMRAGVERAEGDFYAMEVFENSTVVNQILTELLAYVESLKIDLIEYKGVQKYGGKNGFLNKPILLEPEDKEAVQESLLNKPYNAKELEKRINETREDLINKILELEYISEDDGQAMLEEIPLYTGGRGDGTETGNWANTQFKGLSKAGALSLLIMIEHKVLSTQWYFSQKYFEQTGSSALRIRHVDLISVPNNSVLALGDTFHTMVFMSEAVRFNSSAITVDGIEILNHNSIGSFNHIPKNKGAHTHKVQFEYVNRFTGATETELAEIKYFVY